MLDPVHIRTIPLSLFGRYIKFIVVVVAAAAAAAAVVVVVAV